VWTNCGKEVEAWSDRFKKQDGHHNNWPWKTLIMIPTDLAFYPEELHQVKDPSRVKTRPVERKRAHDLSALFAGITEEDGRKKQRRDDDDDVHEDLQPDYDDEEEETDYVIAYGDDELDVFEDGGGDEDY
jgi:hypothetical protein